MERELVAAAQAIAFRAEDLKVDVFGPAAVATFVLDWSATMPDGETYAARSRATLVLVDDHEDWKIVHEHFSAFPSAAVAEARRESGTRGPRPMGASVRPSNVVREWNREDLV